MLRSNLFLKLHGVCKKARLGYDTQSDQSAKCCRSFKFSSFNQDQVGAPEKRSLEFNIKKVI